MITITEQIKFLLLQNRLFTRIPKKVEMGAGHSSPSSSSLSFSLSNQICFTSTTLRKYHKSPSNNLLINPSAKLSHTHLRKSTNFTMIDSSSSAILPVKCGAKVEEMKTKEGFFVNPSSDPHSIEKELLEKMIYDALVWSSLHGLVVGDRCVQVRPSPILNQFSSDQNWSKNFI